MVYHAVTRLVLGVFLIGYTFFYVAAPTGSLNIGLCFIALGMFNIVRSLIILSGERGKA